MERRNEWYNTKTKNKDGIIMGNKPNMKPGTNELRRRSDYLLQEVQRLNNFFEYVHKLTTEYIAWSGDEDKFKEYLKENMNANKEEGGELRKSSEADRDTGKGKPNTKSRTKKKKKDNKSTTTTDRIKDTGESGNIGL